MADDNGRDYSEPVTTALTVQPKYKAASLIPYQSEWESMQEMAKVLVESGFLPEALNTWQKTLTVLLAGRELGVPPMQAIRGIHVVKGRPSLSAELMLALAYQNIPGFKFEVSGNEQVCKATAQRPGSNPVTISFSLSDAQRAGLARGDNWTKYPAAMLRARATSAVLRIVAPDAIRGIHTPDEIGASEREIEVSKLAAARGVDVPAVNVVTVEEVEDGNRS
jgi:hypothetical protein